MQGLDAAGEGEAPFLVNVEIIISHCPNVSEDLTVSPQQ